ncbi:MAG: hypothetical protein WC554_17095 [Clostridia bacterium]|jgi:hypothetical protein
MKKILLLAVLVLAVGLAYGGTRSDWIGGPADQGCLRFYDSTSAVQIVTFNVNGVTITGLVVGAGSSIPAAYIDSGNIAIARLSNAIAMRSDTNATTTPATYTPTFIGDRLAGAEGSSQRVWTATGVTTNDWTIKFNDN